jgi:DNA-binding transcriptional MocR family regulator
VIIDRPGYLGAIQSFRAAGAKLIGWDVARAEIDELEDLVLRYRPKLIYTNPTFQNPTGTTMPIRTRREMLKLAERYRVPIVEDATYGELYFHEAPPPSLRDLDASNLVIHLNSFSKVMARDCGSAGSRRRHRSSIKSRSSSSAWIRIPRTSCSLRWRGSFDREALRRT